MFSGGSVRLVDASSKTVHKLAPGTTYLLASHPHLFLPSLETQSPSITLSLQLLLPPPLTPHEQYCCKLEVDDEGCGLMSVWVGECSVDQKKLTTSHSPVSLRNESVLQLGQNLVLQYMIRSEMLPRRRLLPQTPGQLLSEAPPSKPTRTQPSLPLMEKTEVRENSSSLPLEVGLDPGLRERLQRIAREVNSRDSGAGRNKPPPPYEQVGNSISYQLLLQLHGNHDTKETTIMIDTLYPMLKYMQLKEASLEQFYKDYLEKYAVARRAGATPTNMHPEDTPTIVFIVDTLIQLCALPRVNELAVRYCPMWMRLLAVFCHSHQNQRAIATKRLATKVVSCMGLGIMSDQRQLQTHGWSVLTQVVATPTQRGSKPALPEPAIALALPLLERQLQHYGDQLPLATAIVEFLACLASTAKQCQNQAKTNHPGQRDREEEEEEVYTEEQASRILKLLSEHSILRHMMKVPQQVRRDATFNGHYCLLVKALVPTRKKTSKPSLTPSPHSTSSLAPPAKPKRIRRTVTEGSLRKSRKSRKSGKRVDSEQQLSCSAGTRHSGGELCRSLSEEKMTECGDVEEMPVVRSEGEEDVESEGEGMVGQRLQEMWELKNLHIVDNEEQPHQTSQHGNQQNGDLQNGNGESAVVRNQSRTGPDDIITQEVPLSPDSLAGDIASVLAEVRQPVRQFSLKRNPGQPEVCVPNVPSHVTYYRTSLRRQSLASDTVEVEQKTTHDSKPVTPPTLLQGHTHHLASLDIESSHIDMCTALSGRLDLLQGVWSLWKEGRGLQAATNCVHGCFSDDVYDSAAFCDILRCFMSHQSPWSLGVCVVVLPAITQLLPSQREADHITVLAAVLEMIVTRFSPAILTCKSHVESCELRPLPDLQQMITCYTALHRAWVALGDRLESKGSNVIGQDSSDVVSVLSDVRSILTPFSTNLHLEHV